MKIVFKVERKSKRGKFHVVKYVQDEHGNPLRRPEVVSVPLRQDEAAAFCEQCERDHLFED